MPDHFIITAERMAKSSKTLHDSEEYYNSCYLSGYVIECYQKIILQKIIKVKPKFSHDLSELKKDFKKNMTYALRNSSNVQRLQKAGVIVDIEQQFQNIVNNWDPLYRYDDSHNWTLSTSTLFQKEVQKCKTIIGKMLSSGTIKMKDDE